MQVKAKVLVSFYLVITEARTVYQVVRPVNSVRSHLGLAMSSLSPLSVPRHAHAHTLLMKPPEIWINDPWYTWNGHDFIIDGMTLNMHFK